jgi:hypothetical protein
MEGAAKCISWPFGQFSGRLVYFISLWYFLLSFSIFFPFWYIAPRTIWQPCSKAQNVIASLCTVAGAALSC